MRSVRCKTLRKNLWPSAVWPALDIITYCHYYSTVIQKLTINRNRLTENPINDKGEENKVKISRCKIFTYWVIHFPKFKLHNSSPVLLIKFPVLIDRLFNFKGQSCHHNSFFFQMLRLLPPSAKQSVAK